MALTRPQALARITTPSVVALASDTLAIVDGDLRLAREAAQTFAGMAVHRSEYDAAEEWQAVGMLLRSTHPKAAALRQHMTRQPGKPSR